MKKVLTFLFFFTTVTFFAQVNLSNSLTACYALDGSGIDPISSLTGTLAGPTPTVNRFNVPNSALYFDGNTQYVKLPDDPLLKPADAMSFSCWIRGNLQTNAYLMLTQNSLSSNFEAYELCIDYNHTFMARKSGPSGLNQVNSSTPYLANTWYHLAITIDNSFVKIYVNGQLEASTASTFNGFDYVNGNNVYIGASNSWFDGPFNGTIDNARFYNRSINASEVLALYNNDPACLLAPEAAFTISGSACAGSTLQLNDNSTNNPTQWVWTVPGATTTNAFAQNPIFTFTSAGVYGATLQASNAGGSSTASAVFTINPVPQLISSLTPTLACKLGTVSLFASGASIYLWTPMNLSGPTATFIALSSQTITVTGTSSLGCVASKTLASKVAGCELFGIAEQNSFDQVKVYYDETAHLIRIQGMVEAGYSLHVYAVDGRLVFNDPESLESDYEVHTSNYESGIYLLVIENEQCRFTKKLFVR